MACAPAGFRQPNRQLDSLPGGWQFFSSEALDEAYVPFLGAFGAAWDDAMGVRWSSNPLAMPVAGDGSCVRGQW